jgi:hypothetical protein
MAAGVFGILSAVASQISRAMSRGRSRQLWSAIV